MFSIIIAAYEFFDEVEFWDDNATESEGEEQVGRDKPEYLDTRELVCCQDYK